MYKVVTDHSGNIFYGIHEMCKHYGVRLITYKRRIDKGLSVYMALTAPSHKSKEVVNEKM